MKKLHGCMGKLEILLLLLHLKSNNVSVLKIIKSTLGLVKL